MAQEKRQSPESPGQSQGEVELLPECIPAGMSRDSVGIEAPHSLMDDGCGVPAERMYMLYLYLFFCVSVCKNDSASVSISVSCRHP